MCPNALVRFLLALTCLRDHTGCYGMRRPPDGNPALLQRFYWSSRFLGRCPVLFKLTNLAASCSHSTEQGLLGTESMLYHSKLTLTRLCVSFC